MAELKNLLSEILKFRDKRNWQKFHSPRNLATALSIEVGELQEHMHWKADPRNQLFADENGCL